MCAAPGGKATHIAQLMNDEGKVICLDPSANRQVQLDENAEKLKLNCTESFVFDATLALDDGDDSGSRESGTCNNQQGNSALAPPFRPETMDRILVDTLCSSLGQRPAPKPGGRNQIESLPVVQRNILRNAVKLLKKGGVLVYSTCTLEEAENEMQVRWLLEKFPFMKLDPQKFDPRKFCHRHSNSDCLKEQEPVESDRDLYAWSNAYDDVDLNCDQDNIGFFIAKFRKML